MPQSRDELGRFASAGGSFRKVAGEIQVEHPSHDYGKHQRISIKKDKYDKTHSVVQSGYVATGDKSGDPMKSVARREIIHIKGLSLREAKKHAAKIAIAHYELDKDKALSVAHTVEKEVIRPGTYWYEDLETGEPRKFTVTPEHCRYWNEQGNAMLSAGLTVPVPVEHDFSAHPMTPAEKLLNNSGWVDDYYLKTIKDKDGKEIKDVLFSKLKIEDPKIAEKLPTTIKWTSPWINSFMDGNGREWKNVISHLALTARPRIINQQPFPSIAAALSAAVEITPGAASPCAVAGAGGFYLSRAGLLTPDGLPQYPIAFSMYSGAPLATDASGHDHDKSGRFASKYGSASRSGTPSARPQSGQWTEAATVKPSSGTAPAKRSKSKASAVEDHPEAIKFADEAHARHKERVKNLKSLDDIEKHQDSYKQYEDELEAAGIVATSTGYGFKKSKGKAMSIALATDASGHEHGEHGRFASKGGAKKVHQNDDALLHTGKRMKGKEAVKHLAAHGITAKHKWFGDDAGEGIVHAKHSADKVIDSLSKRGYQHTHTSKDEDGEHHEVLTHPKTGHKISVLHHKDKPGHSRIVVSHSGKGAAMSIALGNGGTPPPKGKPGKGKPPVVEDDDDTDDLEDDDDSDDIVDDDNPNEDAIDSNDDLNEDGTPDVLQASGDIGMEELLCDLLQALGVPMPDESNAQEFKRHLYEATMSKIKELTSEGMGKAKKDKFEPDQNKPPNQNPHASQPKQNPLIQQEQQPMYMSLDEINKLEDPLKSVALSMYNETVKAQAKAAEAEKILNSLRDAKLKEENAKRNSRVALIGKLSPKVKSDLEAMLALPAMALSMGEGGTIVDPMASTLAVLEKGLADLPAMLTQDRAALSVAPQPTDADTLSEERADKLADMMARQMGCAPATKAG